MVLTNIASISLANMTARTTLAKLPYPSFAPSDRSSSQLPLLSTMTTESISSPTAGKRETEEMQLFNEVRSRRVSRERELAIALTTTRVLEAQLTQQASPAHLTSLSLELTKSHAAL